MKKIVVTGASSGIGAAITTALLAANKTVIGVCRRHPYQQQNYHAYPIDFSQTSNLEQQFKQIASQHPDIDAMICCAGYGRFVSLEQFSFEEMQAMMQVNFLSQALLTKILLPLFKKRDQGKIIFIGSECALDGYQYASIYAASKHALRGFARSIRQECRQRNIAVSIINPGLVATPFFDTLDITPGSAIENAISVQQVCQLLQTVLSLENNCVVEEINCQPLLAKINKKRTKD